MSPNQQIEVRVRNPGLERAWDRVQYLVWDQVRTQVLEEVWVQVRFRIQISLENQVFEKINR